MDFRGTHCIWCIQRKAPEGNCLNCPRYQKYGLGENIAMDSQAFCEMCVHNLDGELTVYCETNRRLQQDSEEPFDCYRFHLRVKKKR